MKRIYTNLSAINKFSGRIVEIDKVIRPYYVRTMAHRVFFGINWQVDFSIPICERKFGLFGISSFYKDELPEII